MGREFPNEHGLTSDERDWLISLDSGSLRLEDYIGVICARLAVTEDCDAVRMQYRYGLRQLARTTRRRLTRSRG